MGRRVLSALALALLLAFPVIGNAQAVPRDTVGVWGQDSITGLPCVVAPAGGSTTCQLPTSGSGGGSTTALVPTGQASLSVTNSSSNVALGSAGPTALVSNTGTSTAFVNFGSNSVTATTSSYPVLPGQSIAFNVGSNTYIAGITSAGTASLLITTGTGLPAVSGVAVGNPGDTAYAGSGSASLIAVDKGIYTAVTGAIPAGSNTIGGVTQSGTWNLGSDTHAQCSALCTSLVVKGAAGVLKTFEVEADSTLSAAAWWVLIYDATSKPSDGSVTPAKCYSAAANQIQLGGTFGPGGTSFTTGITIAVSTTGCFTSTSSTHGAIFADFQ